jgi:hypothetical protein
MLPKLHKTLPPSRPSEPPGAWLGSYVGALAAPHTPRHGYPPEWKQRVCLEGNSRIDSSPE